MKTFNKFVLVIFSVIILVLGVLINLIAIGWLDIDIAFTILKKAFVENPAKQIILVVTEISMLFALLAIFLDSPDKKESRKGQDVLMQNDNGKLMISRDTIENLVNAVVSKFEGAKEARTKILLDNENNLIVNVDLLVAENVVIKELTVNIQNKIKEAIKRASDLDVKEVNVRIKNIESIKVVEGEKDG